MKLYVVEREYDYEGFSIEGIFTDKNKAIELKEKVEKEPYCDSTTIEEFELQ